MAQTATIPTPRTQMMGGQRLTWGGMPSRAEFKSTALRGTLIAVSVGIGLVGMFGSAVPVIGQIAATPLMAAAHVVDRFKNGVVKDDELKFRAAYYSQQIFGTLGIQAQPGRRATVNEFKQASHLNPSIKKLYDAPEKLERNENRSSLLMNGAIAGASALIPGGGAVAGVGDAIKVTAEAAKIAGETSKAMVKVKALMPGLKHAVGLGAAGFAGGALAEAISKKEVDPQELTEAIDKTLKEAQAQGMDLRNAVSPNLIFMLRVAQNSKLQAQIKERHGMAFHKMLPEQQLLVMTENDEMRRLKAAVETEAQALGMGILSATTLGASEPNLKGIAPGLASSRGGSFASRVTASRAAANQLNV